MSHLGLTRAFVALADTGEETLVQFYTALFQRSPDLYQPGRYAEFHWPQLRLGIFQPKQAHRTEFVQPSSGAMSLCFCVANLEEAIAHLQHLGYPPPGERAIASHGREIYAYDPLGNRLILYEPTVAPS